MSRNSILANIKVHSQIKELIEECESSFLSNPSFNLQNNGLNNTESNNNTETNNISETNHNTTEQETFQSNDTIQSKILFKCKIALEKLNFELEEERKLTTNFQLKNDEYIKALSQKDHETLQIRQKNDILIQKIEKNNELVKTLQHENSIQKEDTYTRCHSYEHNAFQMRESIMAKNSEVQDLKTQILKLENSLISRDHLINNWSNTIVDIDNKMMRNNDDLKTMATERENNKFHLVECIKFIKDKQENQNNPSGNTVLFSTLTNYSTNSNRLNTNQYDSRQYGTKISDSQALHGLEDLSTHQKRQINENFDQYEEIKGCLMNKVTELEGQVEVLHTDRINSTSDKVEISAYNSLKKDLQIQKEEECKYQLVIQEQSSMISNYKDLVENHKDSHCKSNDENKHLYLEKIRLEKEVEDLNSIIKIYEERDGNAHLRIENERKKDKEEISKLISVNDDLKDILQQREEKISQLKKNVKTQSEQIKLDNIEKNREIQTEREKNDQYKSSFNDIKQNLNDLSCYYNSSIKTFNENKFEKDIDVRDLNVVSKENLQYDLSSNGNTTKFNKDRIFDISSSRNSLLLQQVDRVNTVPNMGKEKNVIQNFKNVICGFERKQKDIQGKLQNIVVNE